jgi:hypothetical protein
MPADSAGFINRLYQQIEGEKRETIKFVQFSDAHLDLKYKEGTKADCGLAFCCRQETETGKGSVVAGKWGAPKNNANHCDLPLIALQNSLQEIKRQGYDYLFWTGDSTPHDEVYFS